MDAELRTLRPQEHDAVLDLWGEVFGGDSPDRAYFEHYFDGDPDYQDADCQVAAVDGELVAAVHICRRRMEWQGRELLCGAIANVATRESYRRRGLSRELLRQSIARMEAEAFAFSILFTGRFGHYGALGWQQVRVPRLRVKLVEDSPRPSTAVRRVSPDPLPEEALFLYEATPHRPLHMRRPPGYFAGWTGWFWRRRPDTSILLAGPPAEAAGYAVVSPRKSEATLAIHELRAMDGPGETALLSAAADLARESGLSALELGFVPQIGGEANVGPLGQVSPVVGSHMMLRGITLPDSVTAEVIEAYATGEAQFWSGDDF